MLKTGKFYLVLDPTYPRERLAYMLADSGATLIITDGNNFSVGSELAQDGKEVVNLDDVDTRFSSDNLETYPAADAFALLLYTSGSTGNPKGALHTHKSVLVEVRNLTNAWHISAHDRWVLYTSMSFAASIRTIYCTFLNGGSIYPYDLKERGFSALPEWLRSNRITIWRTMTTTFRNFMATLPSNLTFPDVRILSIGGEPVLRGDVEFFNRHFAPSSVIAHGMGPTECFTVCQNYIPTRNADRGKQARHRLAAARQRDSAARRKRQRGAGWRSRRDLRAEPLPVDRILERLRAHPGRIST